MYSYIFLVSFDIQKYPNIEPQIDSFFKTDILFYFNSEEEKETAFGCYTELMDLNEEQMREEAPQWLVEYMDEEQRVQQCIGGMNMRKRLNPHHMDGPFSIKMKEDVLDRDNIQELLTNKDEEHTLMDFLNSARL